MVCACLCVYTSYLIHCEESSILVERAAWLSYLMIYPITFPVILNFISCYQMPLTTRQDDPHIISLLQENHTSCSKFTGDRVSAVDHQEGWTASPNIKIFKLIYILRRNSWTHSLDHVATPKSTRKPNYSLSPHFILFHQILLHYHLSGDASARVPQHVQSNPSYTMPETFVFTNLPNAQG